MIFALSGSVCSGKETLAVYLKDRFNFIPVDMRKVLRDSLRIEGSDLELESLYSSGKTTTMLIEYAGEQDEALEKIYEKVFEDMKGDWKRPYVFYPFLVSKAMESYV